MPLAENSSAYLKKEDQAVCSEIQEESDLAQPSVSHHIKVLIEGFN
jgi:predicted transcriptional regulator